MFFWEGATIAIHTVVWGFFHVSMPGVKCGLVIGQFYLGSV
jgi:hypothetical protein